ncbi:DUF1501 domain-containing protein [Rivibacter subsaxonicus]|uniref:Uncharacterized protein (DUF1501 family) n=1 Tax=Rivibacter subsaxonicus TaxID=457575 RepID=A0A4Q7VGH7_9BURK|nr:DUF1501 domain-containing protein [Rivibacter subsaxonicus]RZT95133.1 uncharacterized protein (DUF1501 family) [Rivibacter subsaxonicus]
MRNSRSDFLARRAFLRRSGQLAMAGVAAPFALSLAAIGEAAAQTATDYKALVCVFLYGGNDHGNTVVPYDNLNYDRYSAIRGGGAGRTAGGIALAQADLFATALTPAADAPALANGLSYALHPSMTAMKSLFDSGKAAVQLNVGPLVIPMTKDQYNNRNRVLNPLPPKLFSHNDQQSIWQSSSPEGSTIGWGGNLGDLALASNTDAVFTCISVTGNAVFLSGDTARPYSVSSNGAVAVKGIQGNVYGSRAVKDALATLIQQTRSQTLENEYARVMQRSIASEAKVESALAGTTLATAFPDTGLADQFKIVARLIASRSALGTKRQVFMVSLGGFDLHDNLIANHPRLLAQVSDAMSAFYSATTELGIANNVTAFTASDFGRTLASNGDGTDHGWGNHHFVVGGAVRGQRFYGTAPAVEVGGAGDVGQGRLLPTTSVDQFAATLATWFGVSASEMPLVVPNIDSFGGSGYPANLGFLG